MVLRLIFYTTKSPATFSENIDFSNAIFRAYSSSIISSGIYSSKELVFSCKTAFFQPFCGSQLMCAACWGAATFFPS